MKAYTAPFDELRTGFDKLRVNRIERAVDISPFVLSPEPSRRIEA
jgi:hypothetical protein